MLNKIHLFHKSVLILLVLLIVLAITFIRGYGKRNDPAVSIITDHILGPAASHGLNKVLAALKNKGISTERVHDIKSAHGNILIIIGLASGSGSVL